jgi:hypothetical protein
MADEVQNMLKDVINTVGNPVGMKNKGQPTRLIKKYGLQYTATARHSQLLREGYVHTVLHRYDGTDPDGNAVTVLVDDERNWRDVAAVDLDRAMADSAR